MACGKLRKTGTLSLASLQWGESDIIMYVYILRNLISVASPWPWTGQHYPLRHSASASHHTMTLPFHADHIGSLIRPESLANPDQQDPDTLRAAQKSAIKDIVNLQQANGIRALTSGEFDRKYYWS